VAKKTMELIAYLQALENIFSLIDEPNVKEK
jgi:hypothetical protein